MQLRQLAVLALALGFLAPVALASHNDGTYDIPVWFEWARRTLDVLIVPPGHGQLVNGDGVLGGDPANEVDPLANAYMRATVDSVNNWQAAIDAYAPTWLKNGLTINVDVAPLDMHTSLPTQYEIVILSDENKAMVLGVALSGSPCLVVNSKMFVTSFTYADMFNINAQEYGHCLGLEHVGGDHPELDAMNGAYPHNPGAAGNPLHCVSNLDVKGLEGVFARTMGQPAAAWGADGRVAVSQYDTVPC